MIAFSGGKRIHVDAESETVAVQGRLHLDRYPFGHAASRVRLYERLAEKRPHHHLDSLAAARKALAMVEAIPHANGDTRR